jgi:2-polyprenyl-3-methyl-5-hydroxy-6-metoxy-1,4-benzoquinol methylase
MTAREMNESSSLMSPTIDEWRQQLTRLAPQLEGMAVSVPRNNSDYAKVIETPLRFVNYLSGGSPEAIEEVCRGYISFCDTFFEKQVDFRRNDQYGASDYEQVNGDVYQNAAYMSRIYYPALLLSYLFSSSYFALYRNFCERFIPAAKEADGHSCEIGIGHGLLSASLLASIPNLTGFGIDISPVAVEFTERASSLFRLPRPILTRVANATQDIPLENGRRYRVMICAEVLEHLPDPAKILRNMHGALAKDGILFLTAAVNMESVDHLYLFKSDDEVVEMVEECGFEVVDRDLAFLTVHPYRGDPELCRKLMRLKNPATAVLILKKPA